MNRSTKQESKRHGREPPRGDRSERLQKVLAAAGHGSRRSCEELIVAGRVQVDGKVADELGTKVDPTKQEVRVDGVALPRQKWRYYLVNKPAGVVSTNRDPSGRPRVVDLVPGDQRLFTVGRLDLNSEGLILVTNDGDLANELAHPRYGVEKVYEVEVAGKPEPEHLRQLQAGIYLAEAFVKAEHVRVKKRRPKSTLLEITLREGRNRGIRRMLARVGHKVLRLRRVALGPLRLGNMPVGSYRELTAGEIEKLRVKKSSHKSGRSRKRPAASQSRSKSGAGKSGAGKSGSAKKRPSKGRR